jgi:RNA polymerase sigma-70 factor (sigma-E family)
MTGGAAVEQLLAARGRHLMQAAIALAGSRPDGEDLLQAARERLLLNYRRVGSDAEGYLRRTLYNLAADGWRRRGVARRWQPVVAARERRADGTDAIDIRDALVRLLAQLPPRQRAVVVLRYWEQLSEAETAAVLGCSPGSVKSAASRGMSRLRELAGPRVGDPRWAAWLASSLRCGAYTVTSRSGANGTPILNIVNTAKDVEYQHGVRLHILVDASTYLPAGRRLAGRPVRLLRRDQLAAADCRAAGPARAARAAGVLRPVTPGPRAALS